MPYIPSVVVGRRNARGVKFAACIIAFGRSARSIALYDVGQGSFLPAHSRCKRLSQLGPH